MKAKEINFNDIQKGDVSFFKKKILKDDIRHFAEVSGDFNPLHVDKEYSKKTEFGGTIAHGMFLGALVSRLVGMEFPGKKSLLMKETLEFKKPARIGDILCIRGSVVHKSESTRIVELLIEISTKKELIASGSVQVRVLP